MAKARSKSGTSSHRPAREASTPYARPARSRGKPPRLADECHETCPPSLWARCPGRNTGPHRTPGEKLFLLGILASNAIARNASPIVAADFCREHGFGTDYLYRSILKPAREATPESNPFERKKRSDAGVPRKFLPEVMAYMELQAEEWEYEFSYEEMARHLVESGVGIVGPGSAAA